jgi:hypothetical protein
MEPGQTTSSGCPKIPEMLNLTDADFKNLERALKIASDLENDQDDDWPYSTASAPVVRSIIEAHELTQNDNGMPHADGPPAMRYITALASDRAYTALRKIRSIAVDHNKREAERDPDFKNPADIQSMQKLIEYIDAALKMHAALKAALKVILQPA